MTHEATVRASHTGHGRVLFEGEFFDCFRFNKDHRGASRVWFDGMLMTEPKLPLSAIVRMSQIVLEQAARVASVAGDESAPRSGLRLVAAEAAARAAQRKRHRRRKAPPRHAHQDPAGAEWLAKVGAVS